MSRVKRIFCPVSEVRACCAVEVLSREREKKEGRLIVLVVGTIIWLRVASIAGNTLLFACKK